MAKRRSTSTSSFGVGRREGHDSSSFYERFAPPELSDDATVLSPEPITEPFQHGDARNMAAVADGSVALVVTSPPYFVGKDYEAEVTSDAIPSSYVEYLDLLEAVFAEAKRTLEPGGRIAVNVANLGRKPYRSLSADVITILQDRLGLLLRGEIIWQKGEGASGSCAWGSYAKASNPVVRDITERVVVASKGRFERARTLTERRKAGLPHRSDIAADDFMAQTLDVWSMPTESAKRVQHPAPFPVELPERLIRLYTYREDLVLDPFMGSGSTMVAASRLGRRYVGYDLDAEYVDLARKRVREGGAPSEERSDGRTLKVLAREALEAAGFTGVREGHRVPSTAVTVSFSAVDASGRRWLFDLAGTNSAYRGGLQRSDVVWRSLGRAAAVGGRGEANRLVLLTSHLPRRRSEQDVALRAAGPDAFFDAVDLLGDDGPARLAAYATGDRDAGAAPEPLPGFWTESDLTRS